ncbi:MAG: GNAT family N-acetyltransferase [Pseudomonadota bacterium]
MAATITYRDATPHDAPAIAAANAAMARETEQRELDRTTLLAGVSALLKDAGRGRYWVAESDGQVVGQIMATWEWSDWRNGFFWWIQSVYVAPEARRQGVFTTLYKIVEDAARQSGNACGLRLYVEHHNQGARETYTALGMADAGYQLLETQF